MSPRLPPSLALGVACFYAICGATAAVPEVTRVFAGGREYKAPRGELRLTQSHGRIRCEIKTPPGAPPPLRWRYKLNGRDAHWGDQEVNARFYLRFHEGQPKVLSNHAVSLNGNSPGWRGSAEASDFTPLRISEPVPEGAERASLHITSAFPGGGPCVGIILIDQVRVSIERSDLRQETLSLTPVLDRPEGEPTNWFSFNTSKAMAQLGQRHQPRPHPVLAIIDDTPFDYGVWASYHMEQPETYLPVKAGDIVTVTGGAAYSLGRGDDGVVEFACPAPGRYQFRVATANIAGRFTGEGSALTLVIVPPWQERPEFWMAMGTATVAGIILLVRLSVRRRFAASEHRRALEAERTRIARDIHDDLGASLTHIAMLCELAQAETPDRADGGNSEQLAAISTRARAATARLREIVWAIDAGNDSVEHFVGYLSQFASEYLEVAGLRLRLDAPETLPRLPLSSNHRHQLFLTTREALHNVVKHARASEVRLRVRLDQQALIVTIEDDGGGFDDPAIGSNGTGSASMKARMAQIGGTFSRRSSPGAGTAIVLTLPISSP